MSEVIYIPVGESVTITLADLVSGDSLPANAFVWTGQGGTATAFTITPSSDALSAVVTAGTTINDPTEPGVIQAVDASTSPPTVIVVGVSIIAPPPAPELGVGVTVSTPAP